MRLQVRSSFGSLNVLLNQRLVCRLDARVQEQVSHCTEGSCTHVFPLISGSAVHFLQAMAPAAGLRAFWIGMISRVSQAKPWSETPAQPTHRRLESSCCFVSGRWFMLVSVAHGDFCHRSHNPDSFRLSVPVPIPTVPRTVRSREKPWMSCWKGRMMPRAARPGRRNYSPTLKSTLPVCPLGPCSVPQVHIRMQQRNGRKSWTTVAGFPDQASLLVTSVPVWLQDPR